MNQFERDYLRTFPNVLTLHPDRFARTSDGADYLDSTTSTAWALWNAARVPYVAAFGPLGPNAKTMDLTAISLAEIHSAYATTFGPLDSNLMSNDIESHICDLIRAARGK